MRTPENNGPRPARHGSRLVVIAGLLITLCLPLVVVSTPFWDHFNGKLYDEFLSRLPATPSRRIVIVDIDEKSLRAHGQWPWPRYKIAAILDRLNQAGATAIGLDMVFAEKDRTSLPMIQSDLKKDLNIDISFAAEAASLDNDALFSRSIGTSPAVLGYQFLFEPSAPAGQCLLHPLRVANRPDAAAPRGFALQPVQTSCNLNILAEQSTHSGFFNVSPDRDGILRSVPLIMASGDHFYPSLALATVMKASRLEQVGLARRTGGYTLSLGRTLVPLDAYGRLWVKFRGAGKTYPYLSAGDLLAGKVPDHHIRGNIVFLGTSATGLKEFRSTPTDPLFPGVEVHATVADNLLSADFVSRPADSRAIELMAAVFCGIVFVVTVVRARALTGLLLVCLGAVGFLYLSFQFFKSQSVFISPLPAILVLLANFAILNVMQFRREELRNMRQTHALALAQAAIIESMASLTETRDPETGGHIKRTQLYVRLLALSVRENPAYRARLNDETIELLCRSAPLHDIGKVGVSDSILLKPGPLTREEFEEMKKHTTIGKEVIEAIDHTLGDDSFLKIAYEITSTHHEKWNGAGYPQGLKGEQIPLSGRLMAIADVYDALTSKRVYREALSHEKAMQIMRQEAETSFDPQIFAKFLEISDEFKKIALSGIFDPPERQKDRGPEDAQRVVSVPSLTVR